MKDQINRLEAQLWRIEALLVSVANMISGRAKLFTAIDDEGSVYYTNHAQIGGAEHDPPEVL